jgi:hypothetical protein
VTLEVQEIDSLVAPTNSFFAELKMFGRSSMQARE